ncbi:MAG: YifB family Mg chelatase-like AAA ATPase [Planctomycetes bacterium]|nr:YifB family Mg chelatase-like AAA ATPase [Planctomycetota bacterium]
MLAQVHSFVLQGIDPLACEVEVDVADKGLPKTTIVGLPDAAVKESIERTRSAIINSGYPFPMARLLVNLAPADIAKSGPVYDLPIAVGLLLAERAIQTQRHRRLLFAGELALDGRLRPIHGVINLALLCRHMQLDGVVVPTDNAHEASAVEGVNVYPADTLASVVGFLNEQHEIEPLAHAPGSEAPDSGAGSRHGELDFADVRGQEAVKRALMIAAAGNHNVLMIGPAGTGKSMLAKRLPGILPPMSGDEALEVTRIYSAVGKVPKGTALLGQRPVRSPHHTASSVAVIGGGAVPRPGEVSLAHHGVLFLDEMPEFPRSVLETLRQPLEDGEVTIARAQGTIRFPARFMLVGAMNPTPKGDGPTDEVSHRQMQRYLGKLSGPLIDRVDIHVEVPRIAYKELTGKANGTDSATLRQQVVEARRIQTKRNGGPLRANSTLGGRELDKLVVLDESARSLLEAAMKELNLSARAYDKIRRVARTIADVEGQACAAANHVAEAIQYRLLDRQL